MIQLINQLKKVDFILSKDKFLFLHKTAVVTTLIIKKIKSLQSPPMMNTSIRIFV